jgi:hypothetical protein
MTERDEKFKFDHYINLIFKHRWLIIIPFCLAMIVGNRRPRIKDPQHLTTNSEPLEPGKDNQSV